MVGCAAWLVSETKVWVKEDPIGSKTWERKKRKYIKALKILWWYFQLMSLYYFFQLGVLFLCLLFSLLCFCRWFSVFFLFYWGCWFWLFCFSPVILCVFVCIFVCMCVRLYVSFVLRIVFLWFCIQYCFVSLGFSIFNICSVDCSFFSCRSWLNWV